MTAASKRSQAERELMDRCLQISTSAMLLFDLFEEGGFDRVMEPTGAITIRNLMDDVEAIRSWVFSLNLIRMKALGVDVTKWMQ